MTIDYKHSKGINECMENYVKVSFPLPQNTVVVLSLNDHKEKARVWFPL